MSEIAPAFEPTPETGQVTRLLLRWGEGDPSALEQLTPIVYQDLLRVARSRLSRESNARTFQPTALVHESFLRLVDQTSLHAQNRSHFYAIAANTMRRVLIEHARKRQAHKRDAGIRVTFHPDLDFAGAERGPDLLALDAALLRLADVDPRKSDIVERKFFGGMTADEIALSLGISVATVGRELRLGQAWLKREMTPSAE